jgi:hypothetical protein
MKNEIDKVFKEFWVPIIHDMENGRLNLEQLKKELFDYYNIMDNVGKVYMEVTGGKISKPNTDASCVIGEFYAHIDELIKENRNLYG